MQIKKNVVALVDGLPVVIDLADFPHGKLSSVRKDSQYDIEFYDVPDGVMVSSYDEKTRTPKMCQVKYWSVHRGKSVEIVNLEDGRQIITDNDLRAIYGVPKNGETIIPSRFTPSEAMDRKVLVPVVDDSLANEVKGMFYCFGDGQIHDKTDVMSVPLDFNFGQFVGVMAGDGWVSSVNQAHLSDAEGFNIGFVTEYLKGSAFPNMTVARYESKKTEGDGRYGDTVLYRLNLGSNWYCECMKELFDGHRDETTSGSANKRLPLWYQFAGRDFILGVVNGLIATDGTVCISHGKGKPQLQVAFSSTSLRLVREFKRCCQLLGVKSSISFSKHTSGGNTSWLCSVSTVDAKKMGLLDKCCNKRKRDVFIDTNVNLSGQCVKNDLLPFPVGISKVIVPLVPSGQTVGVDVSVVGEEEMARRHRYQALAINVRNRASNGSITRGLVFKIKELGDEIANKNTHEYATGVARFNEISRRFDSYLSSDNGGSRRSWKVSVTEEDLSLMSRGWNAAKPRFATTWSTDVRSSVNAIHLAKKKGFITWTQLLSIKELFDSYTSPNTELRDCQALKDMISLAESKVSWVGISSVEKTGKVEVGYDLTVPGPDTFVSDDGIVLSNTVNIHVPASEKAAKQALEKMLPSKNLFSLTDLKSVRYKPEKEQISGLWALTRGRTKRPTRYFSSKAEAIRAYRNGEIGPNDPIDIKEP